MLPMLRCSTTALEQYRRFMVYDYVDENAMCARIRGIPIKPTWQMEAGKCFHSVLENYDSIVTDQEHATLLNVNPSEKTPLFNPEGGMNRDNYVQQGCYIFNRHHVAAAREKIGHCLWEVKGNRIFQTSFGPVNVIAKADNVWGEMVQDTKVKFEKPDGKDWESDMQWRLYLLVHGASIFRYNAFSFREPKELADTPGVYSMEMTDWIGFSFFPYQDMEKDCMVWIEDFLTWCDSHKLLPFLHREPRDA